MGSGLGLFAQNHIQSDQLAVPVHLNLNGVARGVVLEGVGHIGGGGYGPGAHAHDAVTNLHTGVGSAAALSNALHVSAQSGNAVLHGGLGVGDAHDGDAQNRAAGHVAVFDQILGHSLGGVDGNGEAQTLGVLISVLRVYDADQLALGVEQATAGVARADGSAGLDQVHGVAFHGHAAVQRADDTVGGGNAQVAGVAHRDGGLTDGDGVGVAQDRRGQAGGIDLDDRDVALGVRADQSGVAGGAIVQLHGDLLGTLHHMGVGDDVAVSGENHAAARAANDLLTAPEAVAGGDHLLGGDLHHAGGDGIDHVHQRVQRSGAVGAAGGGTGGIGALVHDAGTAGLVGHVEARVAAAEAYACHQHQCQGARGNLFQPGMALFHAGGLGLAAHGSGGAKARCGSAGIGVVGAAAGAHGRFTGGAHRGVGSGGGVAAAAVRVAAGIIIFPFVFHTLSSFQVNRDP